MNHDTESVCLNCGAVFEYHGTSYTHTLSEKDLQEVIAQKKKELEQGEHCSQCSSNSKVFYH